jgi:hypothetical protein
VETQQPSWFAHALAEWEIVATVAAGIAVVVLLVSIVPRWQVRTRQIKEDAKRLELLNEYRRTLAQILGGAFVVIGLFATWRQLTITAEGATLEELRFAMERVEKCTDELVKERPASAAIGELGSWLHRSSDVSLRCRIQTVLEGYIRSTRQKTPPAAEDGETQVQSYAENVELAFRQRRRTATCETFNLVNLDLGNLSVESVDLSHALLSDSNLDGTKLAGSDLSWTDLTGASLVGADLTRASLEGATGLSIRQVEAAIIENTLLPEAIDWRR